MSNIFDRVIDRTGTSSFKWDFRAEMTGVPDILPMWVADMDFAAPEPVVEALQQRAAHGVYGYTGHPDSFYEAVSRWFHDMHDWPIAPGSMVVTPGVVPALNMAVRAFTRPGDRIVLQPPVYYPFMWAVDNNEREIVYNPLERAENAWRMNLDHLEEKFRTGVRMLILCSPHNPVARVWSRRELSELAEVCKRHDVLVVSDEIHADLAMPDFRHLPLETLAPDLEDRLITCTSPSKTFNLAGLQVSTIVIPNPGLREKFAAAMKSSGLGLSNPFGITAAEAAYRHGREWRDGLIRYIRDNQAFLVEFCGEHIPWARPMPLEGTYLSWIDCRDAKLNDETLKKRLREEARVWLDDGPMFGPGGEGFQRMNIACPRATLEKALHRMAAMPLT